MGCCGFGFQLGNPVFELLYVGLVVGYGRLGSVVGF